MSSKKPKVVIVGAGPAGLFAARELRGKADIIIIEQGKKIEKRECYISSEGKCRKCKPCDKIYGIGGAGLLTDGKLLFHTRTGTNLPELIGIKKTRELVDKTQKIFEEYGVKLDERNFKAEEEMKTKAAQHGIEYIPTDQAHIGSDRLPNIMKKFVSDLEAEIITGEKAVDFDGKKLICENKTYDFDYLLFGTGRDGPLEKIAKKHNMQYEYNPVDIGVRVEIPAEIMKKACDISWDFKARMLTSTYEDPIRTFCVCPNGFVGKEEHNNYCLVNGESRKDEKSDNTNFAFLTHWRPKDPVESGNVFGEIIAEKAAKIWAGKPGIQRLGDLRRGRKSTWERIEKYNEPKPTLRDVTPGDLGSGIEYRFLLNILEGLEILNKIIPGVAQDSTLLYAPEIKFHGIKLLTDPYLQTNIPGVYVGGDASGYSRGIIGAACTGLLAAEGILREL